jgi:hypothetical protein
MALLDTGMTQGPPSPTAGSARPHVAGGLDGGGRGGAGTRWASADSALAEVSARRHVRRVAVRVSNGHGRGCRVCRPDPRLGAWDWTSSHDLRYFYADGQVRFQFSARSVFNAAGAGYAPLLVGVIAAAPLGPRGARRC